MDASKWENDIENIAPLRSGRKADMLEAFARRKEISITGENEELTKTQNAFEEKIRLASSLSSSEDGSVDLLSLWIEYIKWFQQCFADRVSETRKLYDRGTRQVTAAAKSYHSDPRLLRLWVSYANFESGSLEVYNYLFSNNIGTMHALFYEAWAAVLEGARKYSQAREVYQLGIHREAQPLTRLKQRADDFKNRMDVLIRENGGKTTSAVSSRPSTTTGSAITGKVPAPSFVYFMPESSRQTESGSSSASFQPRKPLGELVFSREEIVESEETKQHERIVLRSSEQGEGAGSERPLLKVFEDSTAKTQNVLPLFVARDSEDHLVHDFGSEYERARENIQIPSSWSGVKIPQKPGLIKTAAVAPLKIYYDEDSSQPKDNATLDTIQILQERVRQKEIQKLSLSQDSSLHSPPTNSTSSLNKPSCHLSSSRVSKASSSQKGGQPSSLSCASKKSSSSSSRSKNSSKEEELPGWDVSMLIGGNSETFSFEEVRAQRGGHYQRLRIVEEGEKRQKEISEKRPACVSSLLVVADDSENDQNAKLPPFFLSSHQAEASQKTPTVLSPPAQLAIDRRSRLQKSALRASTQTFLMELLDEKDSDGENQPQSTDKSHDPDLRFCRDECDDDKENDNYVTFSETPATFTYLQTTTHEEASSRATLGSSRPLLSISSSPPHTHSTIGNVGLTRSQMLKCALARSSSNLMPTAEDSNNTMTMTNFALTEALDMQNTVDITAGLRMAASIKDDDDDTELRAILAGTLDDTKLRALLPHDFANLGGGGGGEEEEEEDATSTTTNLFRKIRQESQESNLCSNAGLLIHSDFSSEAIPTNEPRKDQYEAAMSSQTSFLSLRNSEPPTSLCAALPSSGTSRVGIASGGLSKFGLPSRVPSGLSLGGVYNDAGEDEENRQPINPYTVKTKNEMINSTKFRSYHSNMPSFFVFPHSLPLSWWRAPVESTDSSKEIPSFDCTFVKRPTIAFSEHHLLKVPELGIALNLVKLIGEGSSGRVFLSFLSFLDSCTDEARAKVSSLLPAIQVQDSSRPKSPHWLLALKIQEGDASWEHYCNWIFVQRSQATPIETPERTSSPEKTLLSFSFENLSFCLMNFFELGSLHHLIVSRRAGLVEGVILHFTLQLLEILLSLGQARIIHGDIKPDNLLLYQPRDHHSLVKLSLIDFARAIDLDLFPENQKFSGSCHIEQYKCEQMRSSQPWRQQIDTYGVANCIFAMHFRRLLPHTQGLAFLRSKFTSRRLVMIDWAEILQWLIDPPLSSYPKDLEVWSMKVATECDANQQLIQTCLSRLRIKPVSK